MTDLGSIVALGRRRTPDRQAVKHDDGRISTYQSLDERSSRLANALRGLGAQPGDCVACWLEDSIEYVETYVAVAKAGLLLVPVNHRLTVPEADYQLGQSEARMLLYSAALAENVAELSGRDDYLGIAVGLDSTPPPIGTHYEDVLRDAPDRPIRPPDPDAPFLICYTSGTTGRPKGAVLTHRSIKACAVTQFVATRIPVNPVHLQAVSMSWPNESWAGVGRQSRVR